MQPVTEPEIRSSFINCSKGAAKRLSLPRDLAEQPWDDLDFLGWNDPSLRGRGYLVVPEEDQVVGIALRYEPGNARAQMCSICKTTHTGGGVSLLTASKTGEAGRRGDTSGIYMCTDLACSLYARNKRQPSAGNRYREDLSIEDKAARVRENITAFIARLQS